ncbi:MAG: cytochrome c [Proteobacteria bacterium]|nr:cytochrome c [Pseudomonadota bacterium]
MIEAAAASVIGIMIVYLGIFNVSALWNDPLPVYNLFKAVRTHSIERHARNVTIPKYINFQDPTLIRSGFNIYVRSCMICHAGPGLKPSNFVREGLYPKPPKFSKTANLQLDPQKLFWVIKNGIRMTGMPAWGPSKTDNQIWALVAFLNNISHDDQASQPPNNK